MESGIGEKGREPFFSHRKGIDVTKLIKQSKDQIIMQRAEQRHIKRLAQTMPKQDDLDDVPGMADLESALNIT